MSQGNNFANMLPDEDLILFVQKMKEFDSAFCDHMAKGADFRISLEVKGFSGHVSHIRVLTDSVNRTKKSKKKEV